MIKFKWLESGDQVIIKYLYLEYLFPDLKKVSLFNINLTGINNEKLQQTISDYRYLFIISDFFPMWSG